MTTKSANHGCNVRNDLRLTLYLRDRFACLYCGKDLHRADPSDITLDHLTPQSATELVDNRPSNLITACRACNCSRQTTPWMTYATGGAILRIKRHRRRNIVRYRRLAQSLIEEK